MNVAWDHCEWARRAGLTPQDVVAGCGARSDPHHTWEFAMRLVGALYELNGRMPTAKRSVVQRLAPHPPIRALKMRHPPVPTPSEYSKPRPLPTHQVKDRECMRAGCTTIFRSEGNHHRMCDRHRNSSSSLPAGWEYTADDPLGLEEQQDV
tara:strand:+ start:1689 stop:2141 length:453 start_codon:yes stop_codon:yes gene_type:complete